MTRLLGFQRSLRLVAIERLFDMLSSLSEEIATQLRYQTLPGALPK